MGGGRERGATMRKETFEIKRTKSKQTATTPNNDKTKRAMPRRRRQEHDPAATRQRKARPATPTNSANRKIQGKSRRVVEFDISAMAYQLIGLLSPFEHACEKIHLKLTNKTKLTWFEWLSGVGSVIDLFSGVGSIDLSSLSDVEKVPSRFLSGFTGVESVDLTPLGNATEVGDYFLYRSGLVQLDLSPLRNVRSVGDSFLCSMEALKIIDLSPLSKLTSIPANMLCACTNLTSVILQGLNQVQKIGNGFCCDCSSLRHLDFSDMTSVTDIGSGFCETCRHLESIDLSGFGNVRRIGSAFLRYCPRLKHVDLSAMQNLEEVRSLFLFQYVHSEEEIDGDTHVNSSLESINLSGLRKLKMIGLSFLEGCCSLTHVDLSAMQNLEEVGGDFIKACTSLKSINMKRLNKLSTVGNAFLYRASSLEHLDLSGCVSLTEIGDWFCCACSSLQSVDFTSVEMVGYIREPDTLFLSCPKLSKVIGLPDCIRDKLPKDHPVRKHGQRYWRMFALLIREKSRGHAYDVFQIWNVMRFVAEYL